MPEDKLKKLYIEQIITWSLSIKQEKLILNFKFKSSVKYLLSERRNSLYVYITFCLSIYQLMDIWVISNLWLEKIMCNAAMSICAKVFVWTCIFSSLGYVSRIGIAGSYGNCIFNFSRNSQRVFQSNCTILHSNQQCMRVPTSLHLPQHLLLAIFLIIQLSWGCEVVSHCVFDFHFLND